MGICYIIASMKTEYRIDKKPGDYVIAADGGYAQLGGCSPDCIIGDFDSLGFIPEEENVKVYPSKKDDTDMMLAIKAGLANGYDSFVLLGGVGGRFDHTLANVQALAYLLSHGARGVLRSEEADLYLTDKEIAFPAETEGVLSVFSYGEKAEGVTILGAEYEVSNVILLDDFPLGVSNSFIGREVRVSVKEGRLLIVHEKRSK
ncbi:MAG: thiamine diphosphokinase [Lachnospiraceae bacterium]|nr:thiamine diphosphokinase [Lachnospiraceae bacterium]